MDAQLTIALEDVAELKKEVQRVDHLETEVASMKEANKELSEKLLEYQTESRRDNIIITGLKEKPHETPEKAAQDLLQRIDITNCEFQKCHRIGKPRTNPQAQSRPLVIRLLKHTDKIRIMKNRNKLAKTSIYINDDYPPEIQSERKALLPIFQLVKQIDNNATLISNKLRFRNQLFSTSTVKHLPVNLSELSVKKLDNHILFAGEHTVLSNLFPCKIVLDNTTYNSTEQFYQHQKCRQLGQDDTADDVMTATTPKEARWKGKKCSVDEDWTLSTGRRIMQKAIQLKMEQIPLFAQTIIENKDKHYVEATKHLIWGSGVPLTAKSSSDSAQWSGKNLLGQIYDAIAANPP